MQLTLAQCSIPVSFACTWEVSQPSSTAAPTIGAWGDSTGVIHCKFIQCITRTYVLHHTKPGCMFYYIYWATICYCYTIVEAIRLYLSGKDQEDTYALQLWPSTCYVYASSRPTYYVPAHSHLQNVGCANMLWSRQSWQPSLVMSLVKCLWWVTELL